MSDYGNEAGEKIVVEKILELSKDWTEEECATNIALQPSQILTQWAANHSDEYDQAYYSIVMSPNIRSTLREYAMLEILREKRWSDERFRKVQLANWESEKERCIKLLQNDLSAFDGKAVLEKKIIARHRNLVIARMNMNLTYAAFRHSNDLRRFDDVCRYLNRAHRDHIKLQVRKKKADLEQERITFLNHRLELEFYKYAKDY